MSALENPLLWALFHLSEGPYHPGPPLKLTSHKAVAQLLWVLCAGQVSGQAVCPSNGTRALDGATAGHPHPPLAWPPPGPISGPGSASALLPSPIPFWVSPTLPRRSQTLFGHTP